MRRCRIIVFALVAVLPALHAEASDKLRRVGVLTPAAMQWEPEAFRQALREFGFAEGMNLSIDVRSAEGVLERLPALASNLVRTGAEVIVAVNTPGTRGAMQSASGIPIVMAAVGDPVALGFVANLARPGANITGVSNVSSELVVKRLALFKEAVPSLVRVLVLFHPDEPIATIEITQLQDPARGMGLELHFAPVRTAEDLEQAFRIATSWRAHGVFRLAGQASTLAPATIELASRHRLALMALQGRDARAGALMSYFADQPELYRRVAAYVARILQGAAPGDLPVEQPTKFELVVNLRTARTLGLAIPQAVLTRADEVIE